jgi:hypothetical protein
MSIMRKYRMPTRGGIDFGPYFEQGSRPLVENPTATKWSAKASAIDLIVRGIPLF